jgi:hypothetical protein
MAATALLAAAPTAAAEGNPTLDRAYAQFNDYNEAEGKSHQCSDHSEEFRFRFYYRTGYRGNFVNIGKPIWDLLSEPTGYGSRPLVFCGGPENGDGWRQQVGNNSASAYNWYVGYCATVYYYAGFQGAGQGLAETFSPRTGRDLGVTRNDNRSVNFVSCRLT